MCGDGCIMEGITYESCSIAGHLCLNNLVILYDDNGITIDGKVDITYSENTKNRFISMNWNVLDVLNGDTDLNDIYEKLIISTNSDKPTIIFIKTTIGYASLNAGTSSTHGAPLGKENVKHIKKYFNFDENKSFLVDDDVKEYFLKFKPPIIKDNINDYTNCIEELKNCKKNGSTREMSGVALNILANNIDNIIIGSADLSESNKTNIKVKM
jgi:transketolase